MTAEGVRFVDCHSHVVPSGDDGVETREAGLELCAEAFRRGTRVLFATPHVTPSGRYPLTPEREERFRADAAALAEVVPLELRIGFELAPDAALLDEDPRRFALEGTDLVLVDTVDRDRLDPVVALGEHVEAAGLRPVIAHPERCFAIMRDVAAAAPFLERGWLVQVSARAVAGLSDQITVGTAWTLLAATDDAVVASDGHSARRPPFLDAAYAAARQRLGPDADALFDGSRVLRGSSG